MLRNLQKTGRLCAFLLALALVFPLCTGAEPVIWVCPACGQTGNDGNFCPECGAARPAEDTGDTEIEINDNLTQIPGETDRVMVGILRIDGSGWVKDRKDKYLYAPDKAIDEKSETCWQFSVKKGSGDKAWLAIIVDEETVDEIWIRNGFRAKDKKGRDQYPLYARPKEIRVELYSSDEGSEPAVLQLTLPDENSDDWVKLETGRQKNVYDVWIYVESVYQGTSKPNTACLSEVMLVQQAPAESAREPWY